MVQRAQERGAGGMRVGGGGGGGGGGVRGVVVGVVRGGSEVLAAAVIAARGCCWVARGEGRLRVGWARVGFVRRGRKGG